MPTLLMQFDAPMQAWGTSSRFSVRDTGAEPSKSGVIGLVGAALGRPRDADVSDLAALRLGVRVDREGVMRSDYHTAGVDGYVRIGGGPPERKSVILSTRYYLAGALFLVGLEGPHLMLAEIDAALRAPVWPLFFGRKAFPPAAPVWLPDGLREEPLRLALEAYPRLRSGVQQERLRLVLEDPDGPVVRQDTPISFADRRFSARRVAIMFTSPPQEE